MDRKIKQNRFKTTILLFSFLGKSLSLRRNTNRNIYKIYAITIKIDFVNASESDKFRFNNNLMEFP